MASFIGAFLYLTPAPLLAALVLFVLVVAGTRYISAASVIAAGTFPLGVWLILHPPVRDPARVADRGRVYRISAQSQSRAHSCRHRERVPLDKVSSTSELAIIGGGELGYGAVAGAGSAIPDGPAVGLRGGAGPADEIHPGDSSYLPGFRLPENLSATSTTLPRRSTERAIVFGVMPSQHARELYTAMLPYLTPDSILVSATKGLEKGSLLRMSQVIEQVCRPRFEARVAVLSGPTFAREIAQGEPAAVVVSSATICGRRRGPERRFPARLPALHQSRPGGRRNRRVAQERGRHRGGRLLRAWGSGSNVQAALITRGLAEITRLAVAMGGKPKTLAGLAGLGDLVLTCSGDLSRNRQVGLELAKGRRLADILGSMRMVAEGVETCGAAVELGQKFGVDLPIIQQMHAVLHCRQKPPRGAARPDGTVSQRRVSQSNGLVVFPSATFSRIQC